MLHTLTPLAARQFVAQSPEVYERFYQTHDIVGSGRFSIPLNPILLDPDGHTIVARQKIHLQCLVGLQFHSSPGIQLGTAELFTFESQGFESIGLSELLDQSEELLLYLKGYLAETRETQGIRINVLSEAPRGYSIGFSGTFSGILWHLLRYIKYGENSPLSHGILNDERSEIAETARVIESILKTPETDGQSSYQTLYAEAAPSVFIVRNGRNGKDRQLRKLIGIERNLSEVLDYGMIYSWVPLLARTIEHRAGQNEAKHGAEWCGDRLGIKLTSKNYTDSLKQVLRLENAHFLSLLDTLMNDASSGDVEEFLRYGNSLAHSFEKLDGKSEFLRHIWEILGENLGLQSCDIALLPLYSTTRGGSYIWYGRRGIARKNLYLALQEARKRYPELNIIYDGQIIGPDFRAEVVIEQDRANEFIAPSSLAEWYLIRTPGTREHTGAYDSGGLSRGKLLVDQIARKIYIDGERVSSKEILSQQLTIDLLDKFISEESHEIHASELPTSTYTQNKSEMMSKILSPLMRTVRRRLGKEIQLSCHGSTTDFVIRFESMDLDVCSVSRIGGVGARR